MTAVADLRAHLEASRAALLEAVRGLTDRDFAAPLDGDETVVQALAALARQERDAVRAARFASGAEARPLPAGGPAAGRPLPPQVVHDLAGARYETTLFLAWLAGREGDPAESVAAALEAVAAREAGVAGRISTREAGA